MADSSEKQAPLRQHRVLWLWATLLLLLGVGLTGMWFLRRTPPSLPLASSTHARPAATLVPTLTRPSLTTASPVPPVASPEPAVVHPSITSIGADADDAGSVITFQLEAEVPPNRRVAEVVLWYDTEAGHRLRRVLGPLPAKISLDYRLEATLEGLTRTLTTTHGLDYWWMVRDTSGESVRAGGTVPLGPVLQSLVTVPSAAPPADFRWTVSETQHYEFYYMPGSAAERDRFQLGAVAEAAFARTRAVLKADFDGQMKVYLVPRVFWQGGATYEDKVQLISYLDRNYTGVETWSYFTHEGTHALAQDFLQPKAEGGPDGVLVEGLAVWASGGHYESEPIDEWAAIASASDGYIPLAKLRGGPFYDFQHETSYLEAGSFVKYLIDRYGLDRLKELYGQATSKAELDEQLIQRLFGSSYAELETDWLDYLAGLSPTAEETQSWRLRVRSFDTMRRYETELDPDARILPGKTPTEWQTDTLTIFMRNKQGPVNVVLETALIAVQDRARAGGLAGAAALLDDVQAALDAGGQPVRPSLQARQAIVELLGTQDRAVLLADVPAYLETIAPDARILERDGLFEPGVTVTEALQAPFTAYRQELVRLDLMGDGVTAQGVVAVYDRVADVAPSEEGRLFSVTFVQEDGRWWISGSEPWSPVLSQPPAWKLVP